MKRILMLLLVIALVSNSVIFAEAIDTKDAQKGLFSVTYKDTTNAIYKVLVQKGQEKLSYPFFPNGIPEYFPLQLGNGTYKLSLLKNVGGKKYAFVESVDVTIDLPDENIVYLNSIQNIKWSSTDDSIKYALNQTKNVTTAKAAFDIFYDYLVSNIVYDYDKASNVQPNYIPSITKTFVDSKGICYDYSSLLAAFMRSKGFPTRLVKGYSNNVEGYHAWNEVLIDGQWMVVDTTVDATTKDVSVKFKPAEEYKKVHDY